MALRFAPARRSAVLISSASRGPAGADVSVPASVTDNAVVRWDGTTGLAIQNSGVVISDVNSITGVASLTLTDDINLDTGSVISWNSADVTITHSANALAFAGATGYSFDATVQAATVSGGAGAASTLTLQSTSGTGTTDAVLFKTGSQVEAARFDTSQRFIIGHTASVNDGNTESKFQIHGTGSAASFGFMRWSNDTGPPRITYAKSRGTTPGTHAIVADGDDLAEFRVYGSDGSGFHNAGKLLFEVDGTPGVNDMPGRFSIWLTADGASSSTKRLELNSAGRVLAMTATGGIGYGTGTGGTVTQLTSKATGVTLNTVTGEITMDAAALAADTTVSFTLTNSAIEATDRLLLNHDSGGTAGSYLLNAQCAAGSASINVRNITTGSLSEAIVIGFFLLKSVNA